MPQQTADSLAEKVADQVAAIIPDQMAQKVSEILPDSMKDLDTQLVKASKPWIENWNWLQDRLPSLIGIVLLAMLLFWLNRQITERLRKIKASRTSDTETLRRVDTVVQVLRYAGNVAISAIIVIAFLDKLGIAIGPLLGAAGVVGIAVGFGAQSLVKDYFNGLFLLVEDQLRQGDVVMIASLEGVVEEVNLRYVRLCDFNGNVHFVPNNLISTVTNRSRGFAYSVIDIGVAYKSDIDHCIAVMKRTGEELKADPAFASRIWADIEVVGVQNLADSSIILRCRFKVQPLEQWAIRREYLRRLKYAFDKEGIEIPYPHLTVYQGTEGAPNPYLPPIT